MPALIFILSVIFALLLLRKVIQHFDYRRRVSEINKMLKESEKKHLKK